MNDSKKRLDKRFLILGGNCDSFTSEQKLKKIVRKQQKSKLNGIWGTLGWRNNKEFNLKLINSKNGNTNENKRSVSTINVIKNITDFNKEIKNIANDVLERYINFDSSDFNINWKKIKKVDDIPEFRLDLFVDDKEGAMVYYYHQLKSNFSLLNDETAYEQFIQCEKTDDEYTTKRDRLRYYFKALPPQEYRVNEKNEIVWLNKTRETSFIIKIITFKRKQGSPKQLLKGFFGKKNITLLASTKGGSITYDLFGKNKYELLIYDNSLDSSSVASSNKNRFDMKGAFFRVGSDYKIDRNKKTLLLIHGTFSNTLNTFEDLIKFKNNSSELEEFLANKDYEQVIAFNHPTISADVFDNIKELKKLLGKEKFSKSISLLSASRGCILSQAIGADKTLPFTVDKSLMFSPANGVAYFDFGEKVATGLSVLKKVTKGYPATYIFALLQFSADYFLNQPGAKQMTFGSKALNKVVKSKLANNNSLYTAVVNDWEKQLVEKPFWMGVGDKIVKSILGQKHDFVVGEKGQKNTPKQFKVKEVFMASTHCKYFGQGELHKRNGKEVDLSTFMSVYL